MIAISGTCCKDCCASCRAERQKLYKHMTDEVRREQIAKLQRAVQSFAEVREELRCIYADGDLDVLKSAQVVGMTTNGVASKQELVAALGPKVYCILFPVACWHKKYGCMHVTCSPTHPPTHLLPSSLPASLSPCLPPPCISRLVRSVSGICTCACPNWNTVLSVHALSLSHSIYGLDKPLTACHTGGACGRGSRGDGGSHLGCPSTLH